MTTKQPIAVIGSTGQVARALRRSAEKRGVPIVCGGRNEADITDKAALKLFFETHKPSIVINAAAYTAVDKAESEPDIARRINTQGPATLATLCADAGIPIVHISTDYVFDGTKGAPYEVYDARGPLNIYGKTKADGEDAVAFARSQHLIVRTSWIFDAEGQNFLQTMLRLGAERDVVRVVDDQRGAPTFARHLADALMDMIVQTNVYGRYAPWGTYHLTAGGETTWHGFAAEIFRQARAKGFKTPLLEAIPTSAYPTPAKRPMDSRLDCARISEAFGITMPDWRIGVAQCLSEKIARKLETAA